MRRLPRPQVGFNYLGQIDRAQPEGALFALAFERTGPAESPRAARRHLVEVGGAVRGGCLHLLWEYSPRAHRRDTVAGWAEGTLAALRELIADQAGSYAASDFPLLDFAQDELERAFLEVESE